MMLNEIVHVSPPDMRMEWRQELWGWCNYADHRDRVQGPVVELKGMGEWLLGEKRGVVSNTGRKFGGSSKLKRPHSCLCLGAQGCERGQTWSWQPLEDTRCSAPVNAPGFSCSLEPNKMQYSLLHPNYLLKIKTHPFLKYLSNNLNQSTHLPK